MTAEDLKTHFWNGSKPREVKTNGTSLISLWPPAMRT